MRPGAVLVGNNFGQTLLDNPYSMTNVKKEKHLGKQKNYKKSIKKIQ